MMNWKHLLLIAIALFFLFFRLGKAPVFEYDEARNGVRALEMLENGHWRGLWFANAPDTWGNKPPLFIWTLAGSFWTFGLNTFALRFPSALAMLGALVFIFMATRRYYGDAFAIWVCLVLLSVKGLVGNHTGRTGDFDAMLIFFLMGNSYFFLRYFSGEREWNLSVASLMLAGAFMTKGPAMAVLLPGQLLFLALTGKWGLLNARLLLRQVAIFSIIPLVWWLFINQDEAPLRLFSYDLVQRFSDTGFENPQSPSRFTFLFVCLDAYFNVWNYVLFALLAIVLAAPGWAGFKWNWKENPLLVYSLACWGSLGLFLSLTATTHRWYFSPALPFVAITLVFLVKSLARRAWVWWLFGALLLFTLTRRAIEISFPENKVPKVIQGSGEFLRGAGKVYYTGGFPSQAALLYFYFAEPGLVCLSSLNELPALERGDAVVAVRNGNDCDLLRKEGWEIRYEDEVYLVAEKN